MRIEGSKIQMDTLQYSPEDFDRVLKQTYRQLEQLATSKGKEYRGTEDRLANFRRYAAALDLDYRKVLLVYAGKHWDAICSYCKEGKVFSNESIDGRIDDLIVYMLLLKCMVYEQNTMQVREANSAPIEATK